MVTTRHAMRKTILHLGRVKVVVSSKHDLRRSLLLVALRWHLKTAAGTQEEEYFRYVYRDCTETSFMIFNPLFMIRRTSSRA